MVMLMAGDYKVYNEGSF